MDKNMLVTGGSRGLGKEIALSLANEQNVRTLAITARNTAMLEKTRHEILKINPKIDVLAITGDLSNVETTCELVNKLKNTQVEFNVIINNAGTGVKEPLEKTSDKKITEIFFVNLIAPVLIVKHFLPELRKYKWGRIINISSISVFKPGPLLAAYTTSKSGLKTFSECITVAEIKHGITCNTIMPGLILTDLGKKSVKVNYPEYSEENAKEIEDKMAKDFPAGRFVECKEVTSLIKFLLSDEASGISGEYFRVASGII